MRIRRLLVTAALAVAAPAALVAPVHAEGASLEDPVGEVTKVNQDISRLMVNNGEDSISVRVKFAELDPTRRARVKVLVDPAPKDGVQYIVTSVKRPDSDAQTLLLLAVGMEFDGIPIECEGLRGSWTFERSLVKMRIPQSCLPENGRVHKLKATTVFGGRTGDWTDFLRVRKGSSSATA